MRGWSVSRRTRSGRWWRQVVFWGPPLHGGIVVERSRARRHPVGWSDGWWCTIACRRSRRRRLRRRCRCWISRWGSRGGVAHRRRRSCRITGGSVRWLRRVPCVGCLWRRSVCRLWRVPRISRRGGVGLRISRLGVSWISNCSIWLGVSRNRHHRYRASRSGARERLLNPFLDNNLGLLDFLSRTSYDEIFGRVPKI